MPASSIAPAYAANGAQDSGGSWKWLVALAGVAVVIILFAYMGSLTGGSTAPVGTASTSSGNDQTGVPESANDVLKGF